MQDNRCPNPNCQNDISETVTSTIVAMLQDGERTPREISCPHCGESLIVSAQIASTLSRQVTTA